MGKKLDLVGHKYSRLTVISGAGKKGKHYMWNCLCDCGNESVVSTTGLRQGGVVSCGCIRQDLPNEGRFNKKENEYIDMGDYFIGITSDGSEFKIDKEDYPKVKKYCWHITKKGYVKTTLDGNRGRKTFLHRFLMNPRNGEQIDHINRIKTDNRKNNLRICNNRENSKNNNSKGYSYAKNSGRWRVYITVDGERKHLGYFDKEELAAKARREAEIKYFKEFAPTTHGKNGRELNLKLKVKLQETYKKQGYNEDEIREMMGGKLYEM